MHNTASAPYLDLYGASIVLAKLPRRTGGKSTSAAMGHVARALPRAAGYLSGVCRRRRLRQNRAYSSNDGLVRFVQSHYYSTGRLL